MRTHGFNGDATGLQEELIVRGRSEMMALFDVLPAPHRRVVRDAAFDLDPEGVETWPIRQLEAKLSDVLRRAALTTYGPEHPQAKR